MSTLIIYTPFSHASQLADRLNTDNKGEILRDPFVHTRDTTKPYSEDIIVISNILDPSDYIFQTRIPETYIVKIDFYEELIDRYKFDKVILKDRGDRFVQLRQLADKYCKEDADNTNPSEIDIKYFSKAKAELSESKVLIERLSRSINIDITYSENIH